MDNVTASRLTASARAVLYAMVIIATYISGQGGLENVNIWEMIIFVGSTLGIAADGWHVPSALQNPAPQNPIQVPVLRKKNAVPVESFDRGMEE